MTTLLVGLAVPGFLAALWFRSVRRFGALPPANVFVAFSAIMSATLTAVSAYGGEMSDFWVGGIAFSAMPMTSLGNHVVAGHFSLLFLGGVGALSLSGVPVPGKLRSPARRFDPPQSTVAGFVFLVIAIDCYHAVHIDWSSVWVNSEYLLISEPDRMGLTTPLERITHFLFRPLALACALVATWAVTRGRILLFIMALGPAVYGFVFLLAANSRWSVAILLTVSFACMVEKRHRSAWVFAMIALMAFLKVMVGRGMQAQGLERIYSDLALLSIPEVPRYLAGLWVNLTDGGFNIANSLRIAPEFGRTYQWLSLSPLVSAIDGFSSVRLQEEVRIAPVVPMSAYGEVLHFGTGPRLAFLVGLMTFLRVTSILAIRRSGLTMIVVLGLAYLHIFLLASYSVRTSWRTLLVLTLVAQAQLFWGRRRFVGGWGALN